MGTLIRILVSAFISSTCTGITMLYVSVVLILIERIDGNLSTSRSHQFAAQIAMLDFLFLMNSKNIKINLASAIHRKNMRESLMKIIESRGKEQKLLKLLSFQIKREKFSVNCGEFDFSSQLYQIL